MFNAIKRVGAQDIAQVNIDTMFEFIKDVEALEQKYGDVPVANVLTYLAERGVDSVPLANFKEYLEILNDTTEGKIRLAVKAIREELGFLQEDTAFLIDRSNSSVATYENPKYVNEVPTEYIIALIVAIGVIKYKLDPESNDLKKFVKGGFGLFMSKFTHYNMDELISGVADRLKKFGEEQ